MSPAGDPRLSAGLPASRKGGTGRRDLLKSLLEIATALTSQEDLPAVLGTITRELGLLIPIDQASIALLDDETQELSLRLTYSRGEAPAPSEGRHVPLSPGNPIGWAVLHRRPLWRNDVGADLRFPDPSAAGAMGSDMIVPLVMHDRVLGTLNLASASERAFTASDFEILQRCAQLAAVAVENSLLFRQTRELSLVDPLTNLYNRRHFQHLLDGEVGRARRHDRSLALLMIDVDNFKKVNDSLGHPVGDRVLRGVARILGQGVRVSDVLARYGGEEFSIILPETDQAGALGVAEKICREVESRAVFPDGQGGELRVTVSIGLALLPGDAVDKGALVSAADSALYRAKAAGKNRVSR